MYFVYLHRQVISNIKEKYFYFKFTLYKANSKAEAKQANKYLSYNYNIYVNL